MARTSPVVYHRLARATSLVVVGAGLLVLVGWALNIPALKSVSSDWATMKPNTALAFVSAGLALWFLVDDSSPDSPRRALGLARIGASTTALIGGLTLAEYILGRSFGLDELLFRATESGSAFPNRMAPVAAVNLLIFGFALVLSERQRSRIWRAQALALLGGFAALIAVAGYLYGATALEQTSFFKAVALPTAVLSLGLSGGILCARTDAGLMAVFTADSAGGRVLRRLLLPLILLPLAQNWLELSGERLGIYPASFVWMLDGAMTVLLTSLFVGIVAIQLHREDSRRARMEAELALSEERYRATFEQSAVGVSHSSTDGRFLRVNQKLCEITGFSRAELLSRSIQTIILPDDLAANLPQAQRLLTGKITTYMAEERLIRKNGTTAWVERTVSIVHAAAGDPDYLIAITGDITGRRNLETQLRQSQKMEAIGQLAGGVAHDFNNILTAMTLQVEMASLAIDVPPGVLADLAQIREGTRRAANLTRQLLLFSRREVMQPQRADLNEVVGNMVKMLRRLVGDDISLKMHLHARSLPTYADVGMLDQVLMNLAVNARDAMPDGGQLIIETAEKIVGAAEVERTPEATPGRHVWLSVSDTGAGIAPENLQRIFEPFFTTKAAGKGTGLGLATVFGIVKQHHGWIKVYSEAGHGTTFQIYLPEMAGAEDVATEMPAPVPPRGGNEIILLVEDDADVRAITRQVLARAGYEVFEAANGVEALRVWQEHGNRIALLFTDLVMPGGISGRMLATQLQEKNPRLKIIFTTGYSAELAGRELKLRDGENFIQKPSDQAQLLATIRRGLDS